MCLVQDHIRNLCDMYCIGGVFQVSHLESSNSAMCEDLLEKSAIIEHYVKDSKLG